MLLNNRYDNLQETEVLRQEQIIDRFINKLGVKYDYKVDRHHGFSKLPLDIQGRLNEVIRIEYGQEFARYKFYGYELKRLFKGRVKPYHFKGLFKIDIGIFESQSGSVTYLYNMKDDSLREFKHLTAHQIYDKIMKEYRRW